MTGRIIKAYSGFYYVLYNEKIISCKARGLFRKDKNRPLVGDIVDFNIDEFDEETGNIIKIHERSSVFKRPDVANVNQVIMVFACKDPDLNYLLIDKYLVNFLKENMDFYLVFNKSDLDKNQELDKIAEVYKAFGDRVIFTSTETGYNIDKLKSLLKGKMSVLTGPSGVGKSSIINLLAKEEKMIVGDVSTKTGMGKQTTRHYEIHVLDEETLVMDSPGFGSLDITDIEAMEIKDYYPEFSEAMCKFGNKCSHIHEPGCMVREMVENKEISSIRYENYKMIYEEVDSCNKNYKNRRNR